MNRLIKKKIWIIILVILVICSTAALHFVMKNINKIETIENAEEMKEESSKDETNKIQENDHSLELPEIDMEEFMVDTESTDSEENEELQTNGSNSEAVELTPDNSEYDDYVGGEAGELPWIDLYDGD